MTTPSQAFQEWKEGVQTRVNKLEQQKAPRTPGILCYINLALVAKNGRGTLKPVNESFFENIDTESKAYFLGFLITDGCVSTKGNNISLEVHKNDFLILEEFKDYLEAHTKVRYTKKNSACLSVFSKRMKEDLAKLGVVPRKSLIASPPYIEPSLQRHFWRGCIDGDGWVYVGEKKRAVGLCGSINMVEGFIEYVKSIDPAYRCRPVNRGNYCEVNVNGLRALKVCQVLYADSTSKLERKFSLAMQLITLETVKLDTLRVKQAERHLRNKATEEKQKQLTIKRQEKADLLKLKQEKLRNKEVQDNKCKDCGKITLSRKSARCPSCHQLHTRKVKDRPSKEELLALVSSKSYVSVGKMFGVSDNAIRKWLR